MAEKKQEKPVSATLATGTKVTAPQAVIDKVKGSAPAKSSK